MNGMKRWDVEEDVEEIINIRELERSLRRFEVGKRVMLGLPPSLDELLEFLEGRKELTREDAIKVYTNYGDALKMLATMSWKEIDQLNMKLLKLYGAEIMLMPRVSGVRVGEWVFTAECVVVQIYHSLVIFPTRTIEKELSMEIGRALSPQIIRYYDVVWYYPITWGGTRVHSHIFLAPRFKVTADDIIDINRRLIEVTEVKRDITGFLHFNVNREEAVKILLGSVKKDGGIIGLIKRIFFKRKE